MLLVVAWLFMPQVIAMLAPGFTDDPARGELAISLTRITFPYLLLITLVTLYGGMLNVMHRFASCRGGADLSQSVDDGDAGAGGVLSGRGLRRRMGRADRRHPRIPAAGRRRGQERHPAEIRILKFDDDVRAFFRALGPATIGSMGTQIALFADTIIATFLPAGALSALYYADRLNQLPIGVIGIAIGTVLLPEMSRRITANDVAGASAAQRRAFEFTLLFSMPFVAAFLTVPDVIMRAMFARGAFSKADAAAAGATLAAYAIGLVPFVMIRSAVATFYARKDTATPVKAALTGVAVNVALKVALMGSLAQIGLALATAVGAWVNLLLVLFFAVRAGYLELDRAWIDVARQVRGGRRRARRRALGHRAIRQRLFRADARLPRRDRVAAADRGRRVRVWRLDPAAVRPRVAVLAGARSNR